MKKNEELSAQLKALEVENYNLKYEIRKLRSMIKEFASTIKGAAIKYEIRIETQEANAGQDVKEY